MTQLQQSGETIQHDQADYVRVSSLGPLTGIKLEPGSKEDQRLIVINEGSYALGLDPESALMYEGDPCEVPRLVALSFSWDMASKRWIKD